MSYEAGETDRRLACIVQAGVIAQVDLASARCTVTVGDWTSDWLPWWTRAAGSVREWRPPSPKEQALLISPSGCLEGGFVLAGFYTGQHGGANGQSADLTVTDYPDGAREHYDHAAHEYRLAVPAGGQIVLQVGDTSLTLRSDGAELKAPQLLADVPASTFTGNALVEKALAFLGGLTGQGAAGGAAVAIQGGIQATDDVVAGDVSLRGHSHMEQGDGAPVGQPF
jgi:phage baseplate assembly protein V